MSTMNGDHLLRTPLNAILGFSELLLEETCGPLTEQQRQYVGRVQDAGLRLLESVNGLSDLGLIQEGEPTAQITPQRHYSRPFRVSAAINLQPRSAP